MRRAQYLAAARTPSSARSRGALELQDELGLVPSGSDLRVEELRLLSSDGFYDQRDHTVYVLDDPPRRLPFAEERVLAHECIHALQDQNGLFSVRFPGSTDGMLAQQALIEGDATLGELLYEERNWHTPIRRVADRVMRGFAMEPISRQIFVRNPALANAPAVQKEVLLFPYRGGAAFVGALLSVGGYGLVAKAFAAPPVSTAQVLHPERYARGELPLSIPEPAPPPGFVAAQSDVLGELVTRSLLLRCNKALDSIKAAEGWRGDRVVSLHQGGSTLTAQQWVLETELDARELAVALEKTCPLAPSTGIVIQKGTRVAAVRGGAESVETSLAETWLAVPLLTPETARPLGEVDLKPIAAQPDEPSYLTDGWLRYPAAGVELRIPPGFKWSTRAGVELTDGGLDATTSLRITLSQYFPGATEQILLGVSRAMASAISYSNVVRIGDPYAIKTELGDAMAQDFEHDGTMCSGRVVAVPLCRGEIMLSVVQTWTDTSSANKLKRAVESLEEIPFSTYCDRLTR
ncbi:MAG TPA: hypothetical protein VK745_29850 [Polyangiaceae bacterium]|nr:hypothetical protein [Polyangiaceae bacterium]